MYTHSDHLGSTSIVTDETGNVVEEIGYLPYGATLFRNAYNGSTWESAYKFTGQEFDEEYQLYNYNARLYDPIMSRFISPDTIVSEPFNPQDLNRYAYCFNNPLRYTDPSGYEEDEFTLDEIKVIGCRTVWYVPAYINFGQAGSDILTWTIPEASTIGATLLNIGVVLVGVLFIPSDANTEIEKAKRQTIEDHIKEEEVKEEDVKKEAKEGLNVDQEKTNDQTSTPTERNQLHS